MIACWEELDDQPKLVDGAVNSVYEVHFGNGMLVDNLNSKHFLIHSAPPSQVQAYQVLVQDEMTKKLAEGHRMNSLGDAQLVSIGMDLKSKQ